MSLSKPSFYVFIRFNVNSQQPRLSVRVKVCDKPSPLFPSRLMKITYLSVFAAVLSYPVNIDRIPTSASVRSDNHAAGFQDQVLISK